MLKATNKTRDTAVDEALETLLTNYKVVMGIEKLSPAEIDNRLHTKEYPNGDFEAWFLPGPKPPVYNYKCVVRTVGDRWICEVVPFERAIRNIGPK